MIKSNNPHLAGGEKGKLLEISWLKTCKATKGYQLPVSKGTTDPDPGPDQRCDTNPINTDR